MIPPNYIRIEIPRDRTQNRAIIQPISVLYQNQYPASFAGGYAGMGYFSGSQWGAVSPITSVAARISSAASDIPLIENTNVELLGDNTIGVLDSITGPLFRYLDCILEYDDNMSSINPRSYRVFATLCVHAVKAFIYNKMMIALDQGYLEGGQELGSIKEIISSYSESEQAYDDYLRNEWSATSFFNDNILRRKILKMNSSPGV